MSLSLECSWCRTMMGSRSLHILSLALNKTEENQILKHEQQQKELLRSARDIFKRYETAEQERVMMKTILSSKTHISQFRRVINYQQISMVFFTHFRRLYQTQAYLQKILKTYLQKISSSMSKGIKNR